MSCTQPRRPGARVERSDAGFTLVEVIVTVSLISLVLGFAVAGWSTYGRSREVDGTAKEIQAVLRLAQQRAVTESTSICVLFDAGQNSWKTYRGACNSSTKTAFGGTGRTQGNANLDSPRFSSGPILTATGVTFLPRGSAWPGTVKVSRPDGESRTVTVEGLTGRVTIS